MMTDGEHTAASDWIRYNSRKVTSNAIHCSEFHSGDDERVGGGKLSHCSANELIHAILPGLKHRNDERQLDSHFLSGLDIIDSCSSHPHEPYQKGEIYKHTHTW